MSRFSWSQEMRRRLYSRVREVFGQYGQWLPGPRGGDAMSPTGRDSDFQRLLEELAIEFGGQATQWKAVRQQLRWGLTRQVQIVHQNHFKIMVMNKTAALEEGFLTYRDMPTLATLGYQTDAIEDVEVDDEDDE